MELSNNSRTIIAKEFKYVTKKMREEQDVATKLYFFSGTYALIQRIFNLEYDPSLILIHDVLQSTYTSINGRLESIIRGEEKVIKLPEELFSSLAKAVDKLCDAILNNRDSSESLQKIATIAFVATGNGYYLYQKGILKI